MIKNILIICSIFIMITGCTNNNQKNIITQEQTTNNFNTNNDKMVKTGDKIKVDYIGSFENGEIFDTSIIEIAKNSNPNIYNPGRNYEPLEFTVGNKEMISGFENGVIGMKVGESKKITIQPKDAYGEYLKEMIIDLPLEVFSGSGVSPETGKSYRFEQGNGKVIEISSGKVKIDFNNQMAGKILMFEIILKNILN